MIKPKGDSMTATVVLLACLILAAIFCAGGFWFYNNAEDTAMHTFVRLDRERAAEVKALNDLLVSNISTVGNANIRVKAMEEQLVKMRDELDVFRDQVADTREKQIKLKDRLASKRPTIHFSGPIPVELYTNPKAPASPHNPKVDPKLVKKIKKQLDEVSK